MHVASRMRVGGLSELSGLLSENLPSTCNNDVVLQFLSIAT